MPIRFKDALVQFQFNNRSQDTFLPLGIGLTRDLKRPVASGTSREMRMEEVLGVVGDDTDRLERFAGAACELGSSLLRPAELKACL